jgi:hypothetical protein
VTGFGLFLAGTIICLKQLGLTQLAGREPHIWRVISQNAPYMAVRMIRVRNEERFIDEFVIIDGRSHDLEGRANNSF